MAITSFDQEQESSVAENKACIVNAIFIFEPHLDIIIHSCDGIVQPTTRNFGPLQFHKEFLLFLLCFGCFSQPASVSSRVIDLIMKLLLTEPTDLEPPNEYAVKRV